MTCRIEYELGDPDDDPEVGALRLDDHDEVVRILDRLEARLGAKPTTWDIDHDAVIAGCRRTGWVALPLPGDRPDWEEGELTFLQRHAAALDTALVHVRIESATEAWTPTDGLPFLRRTRGNTSFRRGSGAPACDVFRLEEQGLTTFEVDYGVVTTPAIDFVVIEGDEVHVLAGPPELIDAFETESTAVTRWDEALAVTTYWAETEAGVRELEQRGRKFADDLLARYGVVRGEAG